MGLPRLRETLAVRSGTRGVGDRDGPGGTGHLHVAQPRGGRTRHAACAGVGTLRALYRLDQMNRDPRLTTRAYRGQNSGHRTIALSLSGTIPSATAVARRRTSA